MRGFSSYLLVGILVVLVLDFIAPPVGLGLTAGAGFAAQGATLQTVDRTNKGDRRPLPAATVGKQLQKAPPMLAGCEPVFSPLSASARANFAGRCIA